MRIKARTLFMLMFLTVITAFILSANGCVDSSIDDLPQQKPDTTIPHEGSTEQINDRILATDAYRLMQDEKEYQLIDLRTPEEFRNEHLPNAINIYIASENFVEKVKNLNNNIPTIAYYRPYGLPMPMGFQRPNITMQLNVDAHTLFKELGFQEAYIIKGGIIAWKFEGLPTVKESQFSTSEEASNVDSIGPQEAFALMQRASDYVIIDTRTAEEYASEHLKGAINISYESGDFHTELSKLDRQKTYFFYHRPYGICSFQACPTSEALTASLDMIQAFRELEFREVHYIEGGVISWKFEGLPTVRLSG